MNNRNICILSKYKPTITKLDISYKKCIKKSNRKPNRKINDIIDFAIFTHLIKLDCSDNKLIQIYNLPNTLEYLDCSNNYLFSLDYLPN